MPMPRTYGACNKHLKEALEWVTEGETIHAMIRPLKGSDPMITCICREYAEWYFRVLPDKPAVRDETMRYWGETGKGVE